MSKTAEKFPVVLSTKVDRVLADRIQRQARDEERPVSQIIRRTLADALTPAADDAKSA